MRWQWGAWIAAILIAIFVATPARAASCFYATSAGAAPASWQTYCWLDFSTYVDATARSGSGQNFSYSLSDGSTLSFNAKVTSTANPSLVATTSPSWTGAAVGNTSFIGIGGKPILYEATTGSTVTITFSSIAITPPAGIASSSLYMFVAADAESTDGAEQLSFTTNGGNWQILDQVAPQTGTNYPSITNTGTTFTENGGAQPVGSYIVGSTSPTTVTTVLKGSGLQGAMFAVRFASIRLDAAIAGPRIDATDQFTYAIKATSNGATIASAATSGTGSGPFSTISASLGSGIALTLNEVMAGGSVSPLSSYRTLLNCTNSTTGSTTPLPVNVNNANYSFGSLAYGDAVVCRYTNAGRPRLTLTKALGGTRVFAADQFAIRIQQGSTTAATVTTTGSGTTLANNVASFNANAATAYSMGEVSAGSTDLYYYTATLACTNAYTGSATALPTVPDASFTPNWGDSIACTLTNTPKAPFAELTILKSSRIVQDGVSGSNPKSLPGAVVEYTVTVTNIGNRATDTNSVILTDVLPANFAPMIASTYGSPVTFTQGPITSGLTFAAGNTSYSKTAGGTTGYGATVTAGGNGADAAVTGMRFSPQGIMAGSTASGKPSFTIKYLGIIE